MNHISRIPWSAVISVTLWAIALGICNPSSHPSAFSPSSYKKAYLSAFEIRFISKKRGHERNDVKLPYKTLTTGSIVRPSIRKKSRLQSSLVVSAAQEKLALLKDGKDRSGAFVIVQISGRQYWMEVGRFYDVNRIHQEPGREIYMHHVLAHETAEGKLLIGQPFLDKIRVTATVMYHFRGHKLRVLKHQPKKRHRKLQGHRQELTRLKVDKVDVLSENATKTPSIANFLKGDPFYCLMQNIARSEQPSLVLKSMKKRALLSSLDEDSNVRYTKEDLQRFNPFLNKCIIEDLLIF